MTVRWKPLLVLSGLFVVIAMLGVLAMAYALAPNNTPELLAKARRDRGLHKFEEAKIHFLRALQAEPKNAKIHQELAELYTAWGKTAAEPKKSELELQAAASLAECAKYDKTLAQPRRVLLAEALRQARDSEVQKWAKELVAIESDDPEANYVIAAKALEERTPNVSLAKKLLPIFDADAARPIRAAWIKAQMAHVSADKQELIKILDANRKLELPGDASLIDRLALLRLRYLDATTSDGMPAPPRTRQSRGEGGGPDRWRSQSRCLRSPGGYDSREPSAAGSQAKAHEERSWTIMGKPRSRARPDHRQPLHHGDQRRKVQRPCPPSTLRGSSSFPPKARALPENG